MEKNGRMELWDRKFEKPEQLEDIIQQIVSRVNRVVNVSSPMVDARLEDGSRVHVVLPPVALDGPVVTIRKFPDPITMEKLIRFKAISTAVWSSWWRRDATCSSAEGQTPGKPHS